MEFSELQKQTLTFSTGGFVRYVDHCGTDKRIVDAARISYGIGTHTLREDTELVRYLTRNWHTSPFEQCSITMHIKLPIYVMRQLVRHRAFKLNEYSQRYSVAIDEVELTSPDEWRGQSSSNKQASEGYITEWTDKTRELVAYDQEAMVSLLEPHESSWPTPGDYLTEREAELHALAREVYEERLAFGVAREQARKCLPVSNYTEIYLTADLRNLLHYLHLRLDSHADPPHQEMARQIAQLVQAWCPVAWQAFDDYVLGALTFSRMEIACIVGSVGQTPSELLASLLEMRPAQRAEYLEVFGLSSKSERIEFIQKLRRLSGDG